MEEGIKQDGQKTVVAFVAGLLIGGLLVWAFSSSPEEGSVDEVVTDTTAEEVDAPDNTTNTNTRPNTNENDDTSVADTPEPMVAFGDGSLAVNDQAAGELVTLGESEYPSTDGWIVVHDYTEGVLGNALGAARYGTDEGLLPSEVRLLRVTESGKTYFVIFYTDNGDRVFDLADDYPVMNADNEMVGDVFTAE